MSIDRYYQRMNTIAEKQKTVVRYSPEWETLEKNRLKAWNKICSLTHYSALHEAVQRNAGLI